MTSQPDGQIQGGVLIASGEDAAFLPELPRPILQALHNSVTGEKESLSSKKSQYHLITSEDLSQLCMRVKQWTQQFELVSESTRFDVHHVDRKERSKSFKSNYSSFKSFLKYDSGIADPVSDISIKISILYVNKEKNSTEIVEMLVKLNNLVRFRHKTQEAETETEADILNLDFYFDFYDPGYYSAEFKIEYFDYIVARGLMSVVNDWYGSLPLAVTPKQNKFLEWIVSNRSYRRPYGDIVLIDLAVSILLTCGMFSGVSKRLDLHSMQTPGDIFQISLAAMMTCILLYFLINFVFGKISKALSFYRGIPLLHLNKGNERQMRVYEKYIEESESVQRFWFGTVVTGLLVSIAAGLLLNFWI